MPLERAPNIWRWLAAVLFTVIGGVSCNLGLDTADYPYQGQAIIIELDGDGLDSPDMAPGDTNNGVEPRDAGDVGDIPEAGDPLLIITEVLINTSIMETQVAFGELGEYIEIKNIGRGPADPRNIALSVSNLTTGASPANIVIARPVTDEALEAVNRLEPIEPGGYFVFVRYQVPEAPFADIVGPSKVYDYGRFSEDASLSNSDDRLLRLQYNDGTRFVVHDAFRWSGDQVTSPDSGDPVLSFSEDHSVGLRPEFETADPPEEGQRWCEHTELMDGSKLFYGSPGEPSPASCQ